MVETVVGAALWALVASVLVGALLGAVVLVVVRLAAPAASSRHALWTVALIATGVAPLLIVGTMLARGSLHGGDRVAVVAAPAAASRATQSDAVHRSDAGRTSTATSPSTAASSSRAAVPDPRRLLPGVPAVARTVAFTLLGVWGIGALIGLAGLLRSMFRVGALKRRSSPLEGAFADELPWLTERGGREIYLRLSYEIETPIAIGFRRPVILIPTELATADGLGAIESLVMHEHAHLHRYDDVTNLVQRLIERIFWFNPLVWYIGARVALEREVAADEAVIARTGEIRDYASTLWRLAREMRMPEHVAVAPGALFTRKQISERIERLVEERPHPRLGAAGIGLGAFAATCVGAVAATAPALDLTQCLPPPRPPASLAAFDELPGGMPFLASPAPRSPQPLRMHRAPHAVPSGVVTMTKIVFVTPSASPAAKTRVAKHEVFFYRDDEGGIPPAHSAAPAHPAAPAPAPAAPAAPSTPLSPLRIELGTGIARTIAGAFADGGGNEIGPETNVTRDLIAQCRGCNLSGRDLHAIDMHGLHLTGINASGSNLRGANLRGATLPGANLSGADLGGADLRDAHLLGANLAGANLAGAHLEGAHFFGAQLHGANFDGAAPLRALVDGCLGCSFDGTDLHGADLHGLRINGANFSGANLRGVNLSGAKLLGINFSGADLQGADLRGASLSGCNLRGANLDSVKLDNVSLTGTALP